MRCTLLLFALLALSQAYFKDREHREKTRVFFNQFVTEFTSTFDAVAAEGLDHIGAMKLAFDYWITKIKVQNFAQFSIDFDVDHDIVEIKTPTLSLELEVENKYTIPVKIEDLFISIIFDIDQTHFRCKDVEIDYGSVSLDLNIVVEYLSRQLLNLDMVKNALKGAEIPIRNVITHTIRSNYQRLHTLLTNIDDGALDGKQLVSRIPEIHHATVQGKEWVFNIRSLFAYESLREKEQKDDL